MYKNILIAGGAGFIGSNIVEHLLRQNDVERIVIIDNLSTGNLENINVFLSDPRVTFCNVDIQDYESCVEICTGMDVICCQAALGSVPRSMKTPIQTHLNNINGFVSLLDAARVAGVKRFIYASSSSVYGNTKDLSDLTKCNPCSFYGLSKHFNDVVAKFYTEHFGMECIGLRYHNVYGKRQSLQGEYSAVIPKFITQALRNETLFINGTGEQYRDFTHVSNVVHVNMLCMSPTLEKSVFGQSLDVGIGCKVSVNELASLITEHTHSSSEIIHREHRAGDIHASYACLELVETLLGYKPVTTFEEGLSKTIEWYSILEMET